MMSLAADQLQDSGFNQLLIEYIQKYLILRESLSRIVISDVRKLN